MPHPIQDMPHGICNTVYVKDFSERCDIRNNALASNVFRFILKNIGYRASVRSTVNHLSGKCIKTGPETIDSYTEMLENANLVERARRFDFEKQRSVCALVTYSMPRTSIAQRPDTVQRDGSRWDCENIVFYELMFICGNASICAIGNPEVDFITKFEGIPSYHRM